MAGNRWITLLASPLLIRARSDRSSVPEGVEDLIRVQEEAEAGHIQPRAGGTPLLIPDRALWLVLGLALDR